MRLHLLIRNCDISLLVVVGCVIVENHAERPQRFLCAEISTARLHIVVEEMSKEGWPMVVEHPVHFDLVRGPTVSRPVFELRAHILVMSELRLARKFLRACRRPIAAIDDGAD